MSADGHEQKSSPSLKPILDDLRRRGNAAVRVSYWSLAAIVLVVGGGAWGFSEVHNLIREEHSASTDTVRAAIERMLRSAEAAEKTIENDEKAFRQALGSIISGLSSETTSSKPSVRSVLAPMPSEQGSVANLLLKVREDKNQSEVEVASRASNLERLQGRLQELDHEAHVLDKYERFAVEAASTKLRRGIPDLSDRVAGTGIEEVETMLRTQGELPGAYDNVLQRLRDADYEFGHDEVTETTRALIDGKPNVLRGPVLRHFRVDHREEIVRALDRLAAAGMAHLAAQKKFISLQKSLASEMVEINSRITDEKSALVRATDQAEKQTADDSQRWGELRSYVEQSKDRAARVEGLLRAAAANASAQGLQQQKRADQLKAAVQGIPAEPSEKIADAIANMKAALATFPTQVITANATELLVTTLLTRTSIAVLVFFLAQVLLGLYRYNARMAAHYFARADALEMIGPMVLGTPQQQQLETLIDKLSADGVDFGRVPRSPTQQVVDLTKAVLQSTATHRGPPD